MLVLEDIDHKPAAGHTEMVVAGRIQVGCWGTVAAGKA
jgi:hypothetical protein